MVLEKTLENPLDCKFKLVNPDGNQSWVFIGRTDAEAETPIFCPPDVKNWLIGGVPDSGKDLRQEEKRTTWTKLLYGTTNLMDMSLSNSGSWWWTGKPGLVQSMESQRVGYDWVTEVTDQRMLRYQVILMENPGLAISPCEVVYPVLLQPPKCSFPFLSCLETLDNWTNPEKHFHKILWPILRKFCVLMGVVLS